MQEATELGKKAKELKKAAEALHQEERSGNKGRKWRKNVKAVEKVCILIKWHMIFLLGMMVSSYCNKHTDTYKKESKAWNQLYSICIYKSVIDSCRHAISKNSYIYLAIYYVMISKVMKGLLPPI
jgi:3-deoxy-D-arabino-heptulosonate 7-phosphate (DAHP) synthase